MYVSVRTVPLSQFNVREIPIVVFIIYRHVYGSNKELRITLDKMSEKRREPSHGTLRKRSDSAHSHISPVLICFPRTVHDVLVWASEKPRQPDCTGTQLCRKIRKIHVPGFSFIVFNVLSLIQNLYDVSKKLRMNLLNQSEELNTFIGQLLSKRLFF